MSVRNKRNLIVVGGVIAALLIGTVLLAGYAKYAPARSDGNVEAKGCPGCSMVQGAGPQAYFAENAEASCPGEAMAAFNPETCPAGRTEPCCAEDPAKDCCGQPCRPDCPKPCCAEQVEAMGCCPVAADAATK